MQEDPYHGDGLNLYAYCKNNPVMYYDPSGYSSQKPNCGDKGDQGPEENGSGVPKSSNTKGSGGNNVVPQSGTENRGTANTIEKGRIADFYVTPSGDVVPATGYRYMDSKYAEQTINSMSAPGSYFGFEKFNSANVTQDAFQISPEWSDCKLRGEFDTLQVIDDMYVPTTMGNTTDIPEPITISYPEHGKGGVAQLKVDKIIRFNNVVIIGD